MDGDSIAVFLKGKDGVIQHLQDELAKIQTGRANSAIVEHIQVEMYGMKQPMQHVATISVSDSKTINIQPFDKGAMQAIEKAVIAADIGINPVNNGTAIILNFPPLTEERRKDIVKHVKKLGEEAKVSLRQQRHHAMDVIKKQELPEDQQKGEERKLQEKVDDTNKSIEEIVAKKEKEIMTV